MPQPQTTTTPSLLTTPETAALLNCSPKTVRRLVDESRLINAYPLRSATNRPRRYIDPQSVREYQRAERLAATSPVNRHPALQPFALRIQVPDSFHPEGRALNLNLSVLEVEMGLEVTYAITTVTTADDTKPKQLNASPRLAALPDSARLVNEAAELLRNRRVLVYAHNDEHALTLQTAFNQAGFRTRFWPALGPGYIDAATSEATERSAAARQLLSTCMGITCDVLIVRQPELHFEDMEFDALVLAAPQFYAHQYALQFLPLIHTPTDHPAPVVQALFSGAQRRLLNPEEWQQ